MEENNNKKRILHVIRVIYDILSALFIVFVTSALVINGLSRGDKQTQNILTPNIQETKTRHGLIEGDGRSAAFSNDLLSSDFLATLVISSQLIDDYKTNHNNRSKRVYVGDSHGIFDYGYPLVTNPYNVNFNDLTPRSVTIDNTLSSIYMYITGHNTLDVLDYYLLRFQFCDELEDPLFTIETYLFVKGDIMVMDNYGFSFANYSITINNTDVVDDVNFVILYQNNTIFSTYLSAMSNDDYQKGYDLGFSTGWNQGYVSGSSGLDNNVFAVIGQAFSSVANIFSIELIPGFPLWILVFTPLIIAVVIVVVKMIKG